VLGNGEFRMAVTPTFFSAFINGTRTITNLRHCETGFGVYHSAQLAPHHFILLLHLFSDPTLVLKLAHAADSMDANLISFEILSESANSANTLEVLPPILIRDRFVTFITSMHLKTFAITQVLHCS
jgi:hypothetical protein